MRMMKQLKYGKFDVGTRILTSNEPEICFEEQSFAQLMIDRFDRYGSKIYVIEAWTGRSLTFKQAKERSLQVACAFSTVCQLRPQDIIFNYSPNNLNAVCSFYGATFAGLIYSGNVPTLTPVSLSLQLKDSGAKVLLCVRENVFRALEAIKDCPAVRTVVLLDATDVPSEIKDASPQNIQLLTLDELITNRSASEDSTFPYRPQSDSKEWIVHLPYSSGSTGLPKGVKRSAHSLVHMCYNISDLDLWWGPEGSVLGCYQSFGHSSGSMALWLGLYCGNKMVLIEKLEVPSLLKYISSYKIKLLLLAPTIVSVISHSEIPPEYDLSSLETVTVGGAPLPATIADPFLAKFPSIKRFCNCYGMTETLMISCLPAGCENYKSVGCLSRGVQVKVVDPSTGESCSFNETGEVCVKSTQCTKGYFNRTDATRDLFDNDGWLRSGDAGYFDDDGLLYIVDRYKEMIKVHINQVAPAELETILCTHPIVEEVCVVAASHPVTGETPRAFVVPKRTDSLPPEEELINFVNNQLVEYRRINGGLFFVANLPKISFGKIDRTLLKRNPEKLEYLNKSNVPNSV